MQRVAYVLLFILIIGFVVYRFIPSYGITEISTTELEQMLHDDKVSSQALFIDVRESHEYAAGHIEGLPNYPLSSFMETFHELPRDREIVIICRSGNRSIQAAKILKEQGYQQITNVKGGMLAWNGDVVKR